MSNREYDMSHMLCRIKSSYSFVLFFYVKRHTESKEKLTMRGGLIRMEVGVSCFVIKLCCDQMLSFHQRQAAMFVCWALTQCGVNVTISLVLDLQ